MHNARKNSSAGRQKGRNTQFQQDEDFGFADKNYEDKNASQDVDNVNKNPMYEIAIDQVGEGLRHPCHAHQKEYTNDHSKSRSINKAQCMMSQRIFGNFT